MKWSSLFNTIIDLHSLIKLQLVNRLFTWSNNRRDPMFEKLDRFLVSPKGTYTIIMLVFSGQLGISRIMFPST